MHEEEKLRLLNHVRPCVHCITNPVTMQDVVSDGENTELLTGGDRRISRLTGGGCMLSALCALLCGAGIPAYEAALTAGSLWRRSAELAGKRVEGIGSFHARLFDAVEECFYRETQEEEA